ncbi:hypothetical protein [Vibrio sp. CK2-1]|uniref:hypothetical protein n=1 Tax=Vibrio sp. CK2-1 TaxID=2912249 RepID=UPI001F221C16|nr:hypothetical protein [Vibrio sp. CK2-1]MCF7353826.1 hypothetical protein [Vibrio sp. CK2-1]
MSDTNKRLKFFIWCSVVFCIMAAWLYVWEIKTEPEAERTAFTVAQRQILSSANTYRQDWMLDKQPESEVIDNFLVNFTSSGWPITLKNGEVNCNKWLPLLWPDSKVFGQSYTVNRVNAGKNHAHCEYVFPHGQTIHVQLLNGALHVDVKEVTQ